MLCLNCHNSLACIFKSLLCIEGYKTAVERHSVCVCVHVTGRFAGIYTGKNVLNGGLSLGAQKLHNCF